MTGSLKVTRSFLWLNATQFLGALNDNVFKLLVIFLLLQVLGDGQRAQVVAIASAVFVVPFLLFSQAAGVLADRVSKHKIVVGVKVAELALMLLGCIGVMTANPLFLYVVIFLMCTQSAVFGPVKYGIVPELVRAESLSRANGFLVGSSYLAIVIGTFLPTLFLRHLARDHYLGLSVFCVGIAAAGLLASLRMGRTRPAKSEKRFTVFFLSAIFRTLRSLRTDHYLLLSVLAAAYFLFIGAFLQQNLLLYSRDLLGYDWEVGGYFFPVAALGIGLGALLAGKLSGRNIEFGVVPMGAIGLTACCFALAWIPPAAGTMAVWVLLMGISGGLFVVPVHAFIQFRSPPSRRGEILACSNFLSFSGAALAAGLIYVLDGVLGISPATGFAVIGVLTAVLAMVTMCVLPDFLIRFVAILLTRLFYRIQSDGEQHIPLTGPALLVSNHVTLMDAPLLLATQQRRIRFLMSRTMYDSSWLKPVFRLMGVIPIAHSDGPRAVVAAIQAARQALDEGYLVCIFAEGALTLNGNLRPFRPGMEKIVQGKEVPIIPIYIGGAWGSIFSHYRGVIQTRIPPRIPYPIRVVFGPALPATAHREEVRQAVQEAGARSFDLLKHSRRLLPDAFVRTARKNWFRPCMSDTTGKRLAFGKALLAVLALQRVLNATCGRQRMVGVLLPSTVGGALCNIALSMAGRIPVNLNFTASRRTTDSAIRQCQMDVVLTSRTFLQKLDGFACDARLLFVEDMMRSICVQDRVRALFKAVLVPRARFCPTPEDGCDAPATVIFSSGSTGEPKGIVLSHHNVLSNIESFRSVFRMKPRDGMCGMLPLFHSFGFTVTLWCPVVTGLRTAFHPNPLDTARIIQMVRDEHLTLFIATPTFLLAYLRKASPEDFASLRAVIVGAEALKPRVADSFESRFGLRPREGYGATELSPVAALNIPDVVLDGRRQVGTREGSVGHPLPGIAARVVDSEGRPLPTGQEGVLEIKGPNVMLGYLGNPQKTAEVLRDGWYQTGDVACLDELGFIHLRGRLSRFSKIGGEMIPHGAVEDVLLEGLGLDEPCVFVTAAPDDRKGEQLVVFYTDAVADAACLRELIHASDLPNLWRPKKENYFRVQQLPSLGSGKLDLCALHEMAVEMTHEKHGLFGRRGAEN